MEDQSRQNLLSDTERGVAPNPPIATRTVIATPTKKNQPQSSSLNPLHDDNDDNITMPQSNVSVYLCCCCCIAPKNYDKEYFPNPRECTNVAFALAWALQFFSGLIYFAYLAIAHSSEWHSNFKKLTKNYMTDRQRAHFFGICGATVGTTAVVIIGMFAFLRYQTHCAIRMSLAVVWCAFVVLTYVLFTIPSYVNGCLMILVCIGLPLSLRYFRSKFGVTAALIRTSSTVVWNRVGLLICAFTSIGVQMVWMLMCGIVFVQLKTTFEQRLSLLVLLFFQYVWTAELIRYTMTYLTSSVVANWVCFDSKDLELRTAHIKDRGSLAMYPTAAAIRYAAWHNLGVMACASLLVALIQTLRFIIAMLDKDGKGGCETCLMDCILRCIEGQIRYMNNYAVTYSAIFGLGFLSSTKQFMEQLQRRQGFQTVYNDDVTGYVVFGCSLVVASVSSTTTGLVAWAAFDIVRVDQVMLVAFFFGLFAGLAALQVIAAAVSALFVVSLHEETQRVFQRNHPDEYRELRGVLDYATGAEIKEFQYCSGDGCCCPIICI